MKKVKFLMLPFIALSVLSFGLVRSGWMRPRSSPDPNAGSDLIIAFDTRQVSERVWYGTTSGGINGDVTLEALNNPPQVFRGTWTGKTRWQIVAGSDSLVAEMDGKINTYNGVLLMRGKVIEGVNPGASVSAQGQVTSLNPHHFVGTIRVSQP